MTTEEVLTPARRRGRRPGVPTTRADVLAAARARFAADGFAGTTIRRVAADAGVDPSLVMQLFRSKDELFAAVMAVPADALSRFGDAFAGPREGLGERVVAAFLDVWEDDAASAVPMMAMLRGAVVNEQAAAQLRGFLQERLVGTAAAAGGVDGGVPDATLRAGVASSMLVGLVVGRGVVAVPVLASAQRDMLVRLAGAAVQAVLVPEED